MNPLKIGKFIAESRKEKQLTQAQLADKLNITNRAVSKWETGKSVPDASIMLELCNILGITVNELLCGERIATDNYKDKAESNFIEYVDVQQKKMKAYKDLLIIELIWLGVVLLLIPIHLAINYYYPNNNGTGVGWAAILMAVVGLVIFIRKHFVIKLK